MDTLFYALTPKIQFFEVNGLPPIYLNRVPIYYYVYIAVLVVIFGFVVREIFFNLQDWKTPFLQRVAAKWKYIFFITLICFVLIDIKVISFQASRLRYYLKNFLGKSLDEARALITGHEIYEFSQYCQEKIPKTQPVKLFAPDVHQTRYKQLAYYLYPLDARGETDIEEIDWIIVFYAKPDMSEDELRQFYIFATRKQGQVLLKRIVLDK